MCRRILGFEDRDQGRGMAPGFQAVTVEPIAETEMLIVPHGRGAGGSGLGPGKPSECLTEHTILLGTEIPSPLYVSLAANPEHCPSSSPTIRSSGMALGEASMTR